MELRNQIGKNIEVGGKLYEIKEVGEDKDYGLLWIK